MELTVSTSIPISFEKIAESTANTDIRFTPVKIYLCHTGENLNGSYFDKSVIESMIPSLSNIPILGYISVDNYNEADFKGHEQQLVIDDEGMRFVYNGRAYGLIPETNDAHFETKMCEDQVEREFLVCTGLLWNKFSECIEIFNRDVVKSQSMELQPDSIKGKFEKDNLFHFTDALFEGACILGEGITPAMTGSVVEKFSLSDIKNQINEMMNEFKEYTSNQPQLNEVDIKAPQEGGTQVDQLQELLQKYSLTTEQLVEKEIKYEEYSIEDLETKIKEVFVEDVFEHPEKETEEQVETPSEFALTSNQLGDELCRALSELETVTETYWDETYTYPRYYYRDCKPDQNVVIAMDEKNWYLVGLNYSVNGDKIDIDAGSVKRFKVNYEPMDINESTEDNMFSVFTSSAKSEFMLSAKEKSLQKQFETEKELALSEANTSIEKVKLEYSELLEKFTKLQEEANEMASKLNLKAQEERVEAEDALFAQFSDKLTEEEMEEIKTNKVNMSLEEIEKGLKLAFADKALKFSANTKEKEQDKPLRFSIPEDNKVKSDKPYASLIEKHSNK